MWATNALGYEKWEPITQIELSDNPPDPASAQEVLLCEVAVLNKDRKAIRLQTTCDHVAASFVLRQK